MDGWGKAMTGFVAPADMLCKSCPHEKWFHMRKFFRDEAECFVDGCRCGNFNPVRESVERIERSEQPKEGGGKE